MRAAILMVLITMSIACVSKRERRQSVLRTSETDVRMYRDSLWFFQQHGSLLIQAEELVGWNWPTDSSRGSTDSSTLKTVPTGRNSMPAESNAFRLRRFTIQTDSKTVSTDRAIDSSWRYTELEERNTVSSKRNTKPFLGYAGWLAVVLLWCVLVYRFVRKVIR